MLCDTKFLNNKNSPIHEKGNVVLKHKKQKKSYRRQKQSSTKVQKVKKVLPVTETE